jgi:hypothetical protein
MSPSSGLRKKFNVSPAEAGSMGSLIAWDIDDARFQRSISILIASFFTCMELDGQRNALSALIKKV